MDWKMTFGVLVASVFIIAIFMEAYKKKIRNDKASKNEISTVAVLISILVTTFAYLGFSLPGEPWAFILYFLSIYSVQFFVDMKLIKALLRWYAKKKGVTLEGYDFNE